MSLDRKQWLHTRSKTSLDIFGLESARGATPIDVQGCKRPLLIDGGQFFPYLTSEPKLGLMRPD